MPIIIIRSMLPIVKIVYKFPDLSLSVEVGTTDGGSPDCGGGGSARVVYLRREVSFFVVVDRCRKPPHHQSTP